MAKLLTTNSKELTNFTEYQNTFKRQGAYPLDAYSVFTNLADAQTYAQTNAAAYVGQTLVVANKDSVKQYIIVDTNGTLRLAGNSIIKEFKSEERQAFYTEISQNTSKVKIKFYGRALEEKLGYFYIQIVTDNLDLIEYNLGNEQYNGFQGNVELLIFNNSFNIKYELGNEFVPNRESGENIWISIPDGVSITELIIGFTARPIKGAFIVEETFSD